MASIRKEISIGAAPDFVWDAVRDVGALHTRLVPGFVTNTRLDGEARIVTFGSGLVVKELIVDVSDENRRLAWSVVESQPTHHNGVLQIFADGEGSRAVWVADLLPHALAPAVAAMMEQGLAAMQRALEKQFADAVSMPSL